MDLKIDHIMFPVYLGGEFISVAEEVWRSYGQGRVFRGAPNPAFSGLYLQSKNFYVEYAATTVNEPYWSNAVYVVAPTELWDVYKNPAIRNDHFLIPYFGSGFQLVSPDFPHLNDKLEAQSDYAGLTILISPTLEKVLRNIGGEVWDLPPHIRAHDGLKHAHDMAVVNEAGKIVAPVLEANPILREYL